MNPELRLWRCPQCGQEYRIPVSVDDPMACPACGGGDLPSNDSRDLQPSARASDDLSAPPQGTDVVPTGIPRGGSVRAETGSSRRRGIRTVILVAVPLLAALAGGLALLLFDGGELGRHVLTDGAEESLFTRIPTIRRNPDADAPLAVLIDFATRKPVTAVVEIAEDGTGSAGGPRRWTNSPDQPPEIDHRLALLGFRPNGSYRIRVGVEDSRRETVEWSEPVTVTTPPLPDDFPPLKTLVAQPENMEPGVTLFGVNLWVNDRRIMDYGYLIALNERGQVVWYLRTGHRTADVDVLSNGHLLYNHANFLQMFEVDALGRTYRQWHASPLVDDPPESSVPVSADTFHHEVHLLPSGNLLTLTTELRQIEDFPSSETDPNAPRKLAYVIGDAVIEIQPDGTIVDRLSLFDVLDRDRIGYDSLSGFWNKKYERFVPETTRDWTHTNAVLLDTTTRSLILSVRHQDCLVKIDHESGEIDWILGDRGGWSEPWKTFLLRPKGNLDWPYHQHGPQRTPHGTILMYDNGNHRARPFAPQTPAPENFTRVVEFAVDEGNRTVSQVWEYRLPALNAETLSGGASPRAPAAGRPLNGKPGNQTGNDTHPFSFAPFYGEADWLPRTGNVLITDGGHIELSDGTPAERPPGDHQWARILEVTHAEPAETVFEVVLNSGLGHPKGWSINRSDRLSDLQHLAEAIQPPAPPSLEGVATGGGRRDKAGRATPE